MVDKRNIGYLLDAIVDPPQVGGNHSRFAYDFCPESIVLRVTNEHSSRIQNCFEHDEDRRTYTAGRLLSRVQAGDVPAAEIIVGGALSQTAEGEQLRKLGVTVFPGVKSAMREARDRISKLSHDFAAVSEKQGAST